MPDYDFRALSPIDFEHLSRDILNADLGLTLQAYAPGRDQGIDLRQVAADGTTTVAQCKHYLDSNWSTFLRAVKKEADRGQKLVVNRYLFVTSRALTPLQHDEIVKTLEPLGVNHDDVWGRERLNDGLLRHPEVERRNIKLWLSSAGILDTLLNSGRWQRSEAILDEVRDRSLVWARTAEYDQALRVLEEEGVCVIYGPPGAGKTFLAEMILLAASTEGWTVVHISGDIEDAWQALLPDETNQIFYYNDFLGEGQLQVASKNEPTQLARFISRVEKKRQHKRFVMVTREQNLLQAANEYDALQDLPTDMNRIGIKLDNYPIRTRAEILFNHLYFSNISGHERQRLAIDNRIITIVEHRAYNPRLIEFALKGEPSGSADEKIEAIKLALDHPERLWEKAFRSLSSLGRQILLTLATLPARSWPLSLMRELVTTEDSLDWKPTLRVLESTWLQTSGQSTDRHIALANPGCRDYLLGILDDGATAEEQIGRLNLLDQIFSLSQSAGLMPDSPNGVLRPELAHALSGRREWLMELARTRVHAELDGAGFTGLVEVLRNAAAIVAIYGTESDADWLVELIAASADSFDRLSAMIVSKVLVLAESLKLLSCAEWVRRDELCEKLVVSAVAAARNCRDLEAYEALSIDLRTPNLDGVARQRAREILEDEVEYLLCNVDDSERILLGAEDIEHHAVWYQLEVNVGPLLDKANAIVPAHEETISEWPANEIGEDCDDFPNDVNGIRQIFSRFND